MKRVSGVGELCGIVGVAARHAAETGVTLTLGVDGIDGVSISTADDATTVELPPASNVLVPIVVRAPAAKLDSGLHDIEISADGSMPDGRTLEARGATRFYVPQ